MSMENLLSLYLIDEKLSDDKAFWLAYYHKTRVQTFQNIEDGKKIHGGTKEEGIIAGLLLRIPESLLWRN